MYSRPGCHLCDEMKAVVRRVTREMSVSFSEVDISTDPVLEEQYGLEIPVLMVNGKKAAKYRVRDDDLIAILRGRNAIG
jgi:hypothetical protein